MQDLTEHCTILHFTSDNQHCRLGYQFGSFLRLGVCGKPKSDSVSVKNEPNRPQFSQSAFPSIAGQTAVSKHNARSAVHENCSQQVKCKHTRLRWKADILSCFPNFMTTCKWFPELVDCCYLVM